MYRLFKYFSWENGFEQAFSDGFGIGVAVCLTIFGIYSFKIRHHMPWNNLKVKK